MPQDRAERIEATAAAIAKANEPVEAAPEKTAVPASLEATNAAEVESDTDSDLENDTEESATSDGTDAPARPKNKGVGKRINELTREKHEERRLREQAEARYAELERRLAAIETPQPQASSDKTLADFDYDMDAFMAHERERMRQEAISAVESHQRQQVEQQRAQETISTFQTRIADLESRSPGAWQAATTAPINYTEAMLEVITTTERGPDVAVYLADHLDEADAISRMSPFAAAAALGRIEQRLSAPAPKPPSPPKTVTKAPPPVTTLSAAAGSSKPLENWSVEDHVAAVRAKRER